MAHHAVAVDAPYQQRTVGPSPFSSVLEPARDRELNLAVKADGRATQQSQATRVAFNARGSAPEVSATWVHPPPSQPTASTTLPRIGASDAAPPLPRDTLHPLVSAMQAGENGKAASLNPAAAFLSNAARTDAPCEAHAAMARRHGAGNTSSTERHRERDPEDSGSDAATSDDDDGSFNASALRTSSGRHSRRGDLRTAVGRAYNAEGGFHEPEQYATRVVDFATSQPHSVSAVAAKALASAMHDRPSFAIPATTFAAANHRPKPAAAGERLTANRNVTAGLFGRPGSVLPPSPAFRQLPAHTQALLINRPVDARSAAETTVRDAQAGQHALDTLPANDDGVEAIERLLQRGGPCDVWEDGLARCCARQVCNTPPLPSSHPIPRTLHHRHFRVVSPHVVSMFTSHATRPAAGELLGGCGLRMGDTLTQVKLPSEASFLDDRARAANVKQFTNIPFTPSNAYGFDSSRFSTLLSENGLEVEELQLQGANHLSTLGDIATYCPNARILNVAGCTQLDTATLRDIAKNCQALAFVNVSDTDIDGAALQALIHGASSLMTLCASGLPKLDASADLAFSALNRHRHLRILDLSYSTEVTDVPLLTAAQYCPALEVLDITSCFHVTDTGIIAVGTSCTALRVLRMAQCVGITAEGLANVAVAPRNLELLDLSGCTALTTDCVRQIARRTPEIQSLSVAGCPGVNDEALKQLADHCRKLAVLNISSCVAVSMSSCMVLIHELPNLVRLAVSESSISTAEVVMLSSLRETCEIVRNHYRPVGTAPVIAYRAPEVKKGSKDPKKGGKGKGK